MEKIRDKCLYASVLGFLLVCVFDPLDPYHLKLGFYFLSLLLGVDILFKNLKNRYYLPVYLMGIVFTVCAVAWSTILTRDFVASAQQAYPAALILLVIIIREKSFPYEEWLRKVLIVLVVITVVFTIADILGFINLKELSKQPFFEYLQNRGLFSIGRRRMLIFASAVFFKAGILMICLLTSAIKNQKWLIGLATFFALTRSGTRANFVMAFAILGLCLFFWLNEKMVRPKTKKIFHICTLIAIIACIPILIFVVRYISRGSGSDSIKYAQAMSFIEIFKNPKDLILGQGFGSYFADGGRDYSLQNTAELSYFDFLRKGGLLFTIPFLLFVGAPFFWKIEWDKKIALFAYLVICTSNPFLYTSTAFVLYIYIYINRPSLDYEAVKGQNVKE